MKKTTTFILSALLIPFVLGACSNTKEQLGLNRKSPDEFAVIKHAPLSMPPDYGLRPPQPGAPRPQEQATSDQAREAVFGAGGNMASSNVSADSAEASLILQAGGQAVDPAIRQKVDVEAHQTSDKNKPVVKKLLGVVGQGDTAPPAEVVNAKEETERLRKNADEGKPVTEGETPSIEQ